MYIILLFFSIWLINILDLFSLSVYLITITRGRGRILWEKLMIGLLLHLFLKYMRDVRNLVFRVSNKISITEMLVEPIIS